MASHGKWSTRVAYFYYTIGSVYYIYHWFLILGVVAGAAVFVQTIPVVRYSAPAVSIISIIAGISFWRRQVSFQLNGPNPSLRFVHLELQYKEIDAQTCESHRKACVKAVYPTDHYRHRVSWSGDGEVIPEIISGATRIELSEMPSEIGKMCRVFFERHLNKGESRTFAYKIDLKKATKPLKSFLGHVLDTPTKSLQMKAEFSQAKHPTHCLKQIFLTDRAEIPLWEESLHLTVSQTAILWEIEKPRNGHYYRISWW